MGGHLSVCGQAARGAARPSPAQQECCDATEFLGEADTLGRRSRSSWRTCATGAALPEIVARQWRYLLEGNQDLIDTETVRAAYAQPRLRQLFPDGQPRSDVLQPVHRNAGRACRRPGLSEGR
ncbi:DUF6193 family natural product biosynthesis protein [Streptomyces pristinaespiralis]|nr:DUF6193 family natural product biosynthesis protein [Streptomyces pristinaespiralis]